MLRVIADVSVKTTIWSNIVDLHQGNSKQDGEIKEVNSTEALEEKVDRTRQKPKQVHLFTFEIVGEMELGQQLQTGAIV